MPSREVLLRDAAEGERWQLGLHEGTPGLLHEPGRGQRDRAASGKLCGRSCSETVLAQPENWRVLE